MRSRCPPPGFSRSGRVIATDANTVATNEAGGMTAYYYMHDMSWWWGFLMMIGWLAIAALLIARLGGLRRDRGSRSAAQILDRRLAAGEISVEEHQRMRAAMNDQKSWS